MATVDQQPNERAGVPRYREWRGVAVFRQGFRPFFLAAGLSALVLVPVWLLVLQGRIELSSAFSPPLWHAHEMVFGVLGAAVAGFLLTAVPNWTGRMPLQGWPLIGLFALWLAGRAVMAAGGDLGGDVTAAIDIGFHAVLLVVIAREIVAGRNWRNLPVAGGLAALVAANAVAHLEALEAIPLQDVGLRLGIAVIACLIALVGGRVIPSFTGNWLAKRGDAPRPVAFNRFDAVVVLASVAALLAWAFAPDQPLVGGLLVVVGIGHFLRLARWRGWRTTAEPLVWSLHLGYFWLPVGLVLIGAAPLTDAVPITAGQHALGVGAMGGMILAVMTRATRGHTGQGLAADGWTTAIYLGGFLAAAARVGATLLPSLYDPLLMLAAAAWCGAFGLFSLRYGALMIAR